MKKQNLIACIAAFTVLICSSSPAVAGAQYTWAESYGFKSYGPDGKPTDDPFYGSGFDVPVGIARMPDGGYVVAAQLDLPELYANVFSSHTNEHSCAGVIRLAPDGTILWQRVLRQTDDRTENRYFVPSSSHVYQIATDAQGNIFIAGGKGNTSNSGQQPFVAKFSAAGALVWDSGIKETTWRIGDNPPTDQVINAGAPFTTMALTHDGGVVAGSQTGIPAGGNAASRPTVTKFNADGSVAMHQVYNVPVQYIGTSAVCQAKNSDNYVFLIQHPASSSYVSAHGMTAVEITPTGAIVQEKSFVPDDGRIETPLQIIATDDGGYVTFSQLAKGFAGGTIYDAGGFLLRKFDSNLTEVFEKRYSRVGANTALYVNHLSLLSDGGYLVAGHDITNVANDLGFFEVALTRISATGQLLSHSTIGGAKNEGTSNYGPSSGAFAVQAADGGYAFTTASDSYGEVLNAGFSARPDVWVGKTDANRRIQNFADDMRELQLAQFDVKDTTQQGVAGEVTTTFQYGVYRGFIPADTLPGLILENPATNAAPNAPTIKYQATPLTGEAMSPVAQFSAKSSPISPDPLTYSTRNRWRFEAIDTAAIPGLTLKVQYSKEIYASASSNIEATWTDLPGGGLMTLVDAAAGYWRLETTGVVPEVQESPQYYYFRVVATAPGFFAAVGPAQSLDNRFQISNSPLSAPPTVSITAPVDNDSALEHGNVRFSAAATSNDYGIREIALIDNGRVLSRVSGSPAETTIGDISAGLHVLTAVATDNTGQETSSTAVAIFVNVTGGVDYRFNGTAGNWNDENSWIPSGVPGPNDSARITQGTVTLTQDATVKAVTIEGGTIAGTGQLTVPNHFIATGGQISNAPLTVGVNAIAEVVTEGAIGFGSTLTNKGTFVVAGDITGYSTGARSVSTGNNSDTVTPQGFSFNFGFLNNIGRFFTALKPRRTASSPPLRSPVVIRASGFTNAGSLITNDGGSLITNDGGSIVAPPNGHAASGSSAFTQTAGELDLGPSDPIRQGRVIGNVTLNGGSLTGSGIITGSLTNNGGVVAPGHSAGLIEITGNCTQASGGTLTMEILGNTTFDQLKVDGTATLGGKLNVSVAHPEQFNNPTKVTPFAFGNVSGNFATVSANAQFTANSFTGDVAINPTIAGPRNAQPVNIATRLAIQTGDNALFAGFIVTGPAGSTKKVLIRGLGPSLPVPGVIADPALTLNNPDGTTIVNDNWKDGDTSQIPAGFGPPNDKESLVVATLTVGGSGYSNYTVILQGAHGETGVGLVEVYDLESSSPAQLANIATRGNVQTGDNLLIGGFILGGTEPAKVLVRASGPSTGVAGALADPILELHDSNGAVISNDNWRESQENEIAATGIPPRDDREPAILETLVPGAYTAVVRGKGNTTGVAVVEAYNLQ